jgi:glycosyltransferase involved in cell wall biosynthesis
MISDAKGPVTIACAAPFGGGGMGRHFFEIAESLRARKIHVRTIARERGDVNFQTPAWVRFANRFTPLRFSAAWQGYLEGIVFDQFVSRQLRKGDLFIGFNGQALRSMRTARNLFREVALVSATLHVNFTVAQTMKAYAYAPVEPVGYVRALHERYLLEYEMADRILVGSELTRETFLREKFPAEKLERFKYTADARYRAAAGRARDGRFRVVSIGSLTLSKGVAVLLDAFRNVPGADAELTLVGGSGTRQMRRYLERCMAQDGRVKIAPGDPLPHLQAADVCVHASFQDGFAYAAMEALACGTPVIVTEETGMKEYVREGVNGFVVPSGNADAITAKLQEIRKSGLRAPA